MLLAPLFPLASGFWSLLLLQWSMALPLPLPGAQTLIVQLAGRDPRSIGRFSFVARIGSTSAPIVAGAVCDFGGARPARRCRGTVLTVALVRTPEAEVFAPSCLGSRSGRFRARDAWPRVSEYISTMMAAWSGVASARQLRKRSSTRYDNRRTGALAARKCCLLAAGRLKNIRAWRVPPAGWFSSRSLIRKCALDRCRQRRCRPLERGHRGRTRCGRADVSVPLSRRRRARRMAAHSVGRVYESRRRTVP
jgi:hypothetical protein